MSHCMLDLETLGTRPGCSVLSIGACSFDPNALIGALGDENLAGAKSHFQINIDRVSSADTGLWEDFNTIRWWADKSDAWAAANRDPVPVDIAVDEFLGWYQRESIRYVWAHGAPFDPPILEAVIKAVGKHVPWKFWDMRDTRTIFGFDPSAIKDARAAGTHHKALDDAIAQAMAVQKVTHKFGQPMVA